MHVTLHQEGSDLVATFIEIQNTNADLPVEVNGTVANLAGNASGFQFTVAGRVVKGDAGTQFFGDGDRADSFASLSNDQRVETKGLQRDGYVYATRIHINGLDDGNGDGQQGTSAPIHGTLKSKAGKAPTLLLVVDITTVRTSTDTRVKRRGDDQSLDALKIGQSLHVIGTRRSDGSLDARTIEIDDDAADGEFEIEGSLGGLKGTCPSISFGVNGYSIVTTGATSFKGGDCASLKNGSKVRARGIREASGLVLASEIERK